MSIKKFWQKHDNKILTIFAIILVAIVAFRAGQTYQGDEEISAINVSLNQLTASNPAQEKIKILGEAMERKGIDLSDSASKFDQPDDSTQRAEISGECAFIGSKNSKKYHLPTCQWAKKIKTENLVCYSSREEAEGKGKELGKCCSK